MKFRSKLVGKRLTLIRTKSTKKMAQIMFAQIDQNRDHLNPWFLWLSKTNEVQDSLTYLEKKEIETKEGKKIEYGIYYENQYLGNISLFNIDLKKKSAEIGYWLSSTHTRRGFMTEALSMLEKEGFDNLGLHRLQIRCDKRNKASAGVATKSGYTYEGTFREAEVDHNTGGYRDIMYFSKLEKEFKAQ